MTDNSITISTGLSYEDLMQASKALAFAAEATLVGYEKPEAPAETKPETPPESKPAEPAETKPEAAPETKPEAPAADAPRDSRGFTHDERIHVTPGKFKKTGEWLNRRSVDKKLLAKVEKQLAAAVVQPATPAPAAAPPPPESVNPAPTTSPAPPPPTADTGITYPALVGKITKAIKKDQTLTQEQVNEILKSEGIESMPLLAAALPETWQSISDILDVMLG